MIDAIVYNPDSTWLESISNKTPTFSDNGHSVVLVRVDSLDDIQGEILASGANPFESLSGTALTKYSLAYPRPIVFVPESTFMGNVRAAYTYQRPFAFGGFA